MIVGFEDYKWKYDFSNARGVIHVGAHHGQEYRFYLENFGLQIQTHWFEPDPKNFAMLVHNLIKEENATLYKYALGSEEKKTRMWSESDNHGESSSLLKPKAHSDLFPHIKFSVGEEVIVRTLDSFGIEDSNVLVLDVQGYELEVLKGSAKTLNKIDHVFSEVNNVEMYEGCPHFSEINNFLINAGFSLRENYWTANEWGDSYWSR